MTSEHTESGTAAEFDKLVLAAKLAGAKRHFFMMQTRPVVMFKYWPDEWAVHSVWVGVIEMKQHAVTNQDLKMALTIEAVMQSARDGRQTPAWVPNYDV